MALKRSRSKSCDGRGGKKNVGYRVSPTASFPLFLGRGIVADFAFTPQQEAFHQGEKRVGSMRPITAGIRVIICYPLITITVTKVSPSAYCKKLHAKSTFSRLSLSIM